MVPQLKLNITKRSSPPEGHMFYYPGPFDCWRRAISSVDNFWR